jgi:hypothetical protein
MSLTVYWEAIKPPLSENDKASAFSVGIVMLACGMAEIHTDRDIEEIHLRVEIYDRLTESHAMATTSFINLNTLAFWRRWRGVRVNGTHERRDRWVKRIVNGIFMELEYQMRKDEQDAHP